MNRFPILWLLLLALLSAGGAAWQGVEGAGYSELKRRAEARFAEGSFELAHRLYLEAAEADVPGGEERWLRFRLADTLWRSAAGSETADATPFDRAREELGELIAETEPEAADRDRVRTEAHESLGDLHWGRRHAANWGAAWPHYQAALERWAGSTDLDLARERYLAIVWRMARPTWFERHWSIGAWGNRIPPEVLRNATRIAQSAADRAHAQFLLGQTLAQTGGHDARLEAGEAYRAVVEMADAGERTEWYDDALFHWADWLQDGVPTEDELGRWTNEPDYAGAVAAYRRLLGDFTKAGTRWWDDARSRVREITEPRLDVSTSNAFLPGSAVAAHLSWRNVGSVDLTLYELDLARHVAFEDGDRNAYEWIETVDTARLEAVRRWTHETDGDDGRHVPGDEVLRIEPAPEPGAWLLEASAGGRRVRALVLVGDGALVLKASGTRVLAWFCEAEDGRPVPEAEVVLWRRENRGGHRVWTRADATTDADGVAVFEVEGASGSEELFAAARDERRQTLAIGSTSYRYGEGRDWKAYTFTDRPAYRPGDAVSWKVVARSRVGGGYETPAGARLAYTVTDPRGAEVAQGTVTLNEFGAAWDELETTAEMTLGQYSLQLSLDLSGSKHGIAHTQLFRLEEYELPEFEVEVGVAGEDGERPTFRLGDEVTAEVGAEYYFGGPVANARVEAVVYQRPLWYLWPREHDYPWFFEDSSPSFRRGWHGPGNAVLQTTLTTDAEGRATITFPTPRGGGQDLEYTIEARVTDSSRREVVGRGVVRVTRDAYRARLDSEHRLHRPGDEIELTLRTLDANDEPVAAKGVVEVTRRTWNEKEKEYDEETLERTELATDAEGRASLSVRAPVEGYYAVRWAGEQPRGGRVVAETAVWVCDERTRTLGWHHGGVELLVDADTFRAGERSPVMISTPASGRWVLFTVERDDLVSHEVLHLTGDVKLVTLDVTDAHVPNLFLSAALMHGGELHVDSERVVVPPVRQFLEVDVTVDREEVQPGETGTLSVCVRDHEGRPVRGEIGLTLFDEAVTAIQEDPAGDPRAFFHGELRPNLVRTSGTTSTLPFVSLVEDEEGELVGRRDADGASEGEGYRVRREMEASKQRALPAQEMERLSALGYAADMAVAGRAPAPSSAPAGGQGPVPRVRADFRKTALWLPGLVTDEDGCATAEVTYPDSLTRWIGKARVQTTGAAVGIGDVRVRTRMPLMARLQAPRFFQVGDELVVSGVLNNDTSGELLVRARLVADGLNVLGRLVGGEIVRDGDDVLVAPGGERRVDWRVRVEEPGEARLSLSAVGGEFADAMERSYPVHERGAEVFLARTGKFDSEAVVVTLDLPAERRPGSTAFTVDVTPSLAVTMLDALPYLVEYPYGCTEQTLSRFLPAVVVAKTLADQGLSPEVAMERVFGGIEREHVDETHPGNERRRGLDRLDEVTRAGVDRLVDFQHGDGGWGWWKEGESDLFMSAYVVWGLSLGRDAGVDVPGGVLERGRRYLDENLVEAELRPDLRSWMLHALAAATRGDATKPMGRAFDELWEERSRLNAFTRALLALSAHAMGREEEARTLVDNLLNGVRIDSSPDTSVVRRGAQSSHDAVQATAHWGAGGVYWRWSEGGVEATATALRALVAIAPGHELTDSVVQWLVRNRRGASWSNTRDTAMCILALNEYLVAGGELEREAAWDVVVNGEAVDSRRISGDELLAAPTRVAVDAALLRDGPNRVEIVRKGEAPLYFACYATFFSREEPIPARGSEVFVRREYFRIVPRPTLLAGPVYEKVRIEDGDTVESGDRVEVVLTLEAKNDLEYLVVEDLKPAGLEAVELRSGGPFYAHELRADEVERRFGTDAREERQAGAPARTADVRGFGGGGDGHAGRTGRSRWVHREMRDRLVALFLDRIPQGVWEMRYELRAQVPGRFSALPAQAHAMYVPEIRGNSQEWRMVVAERE